MKRVAIIAVGVLMLATITAHAQVGVPEVVGDPNTYTVSYTLDDLACVSGVGSPDECAVPNETANEGGYPWTLVKCKEGDATLSMSAWSLMRNAPLRIFEAPVALSQTPTKTDTEKVRLQKSCKRLTKPAPAEKPGKEEVVIQEN